MSPAAATFTIFDKHGERCMRMPGMHLLSQKIDDIAVSRY